MQPGYTRTKTTLLKDMEHYRKYAFPVFNELDAAFMQPSHMKIRLIYCSEN